jgi:hypothetical protein
VTGELVRKRGKWRTVRDGVPLVLTGGRREPDPAAVAALGLFDPEAAKASVAPALEEHRDAPFTWDEVRTVYLFADGDGLVEWGLMTAWDEEHTLGARFRDGALVELNGSVLAP